MSLRSSRLYGAIESDSLDDIVNELITFCRSGNDINVQDTVSGETYLHHIVRHYRRFSDPKNVSLLYMVGCKLDVDAVDADGETALHKVVRKNGAYRLMVAMLRCGADTEVKNKDGKTAEDILLTEKPSGWQEMLHWYRKFKPGLWRALMADSPDKKLIERLLKSWCRVVVCKNKQIVNLKEVAHNRVGQLDIVCLMEKYENTNEFVLSLLAGTGRFISYWKENGLAMNNIDINTRDYSYQYRYPDYPEVPQPLLAALWEKDIFEIVDILMEMKPDTSVLYSNEPESKSPPKPLFFQVLSGHPKPTDERIVRRIIRGSDMQARNTYGATILMEAIVSQQSDDFIHFLFQCGVNVATRARCGRTARTLCDEEAVQDGARYTRLIDQHVLGFVRDCNIERLERLVLQSYNHILDIVDERGHTALQIARKLGSKQLIRILQNVVATQDHAKKVFAAIDKGNMTLLKKLLTKKYAHVLDKCGRTTVHHACLHQHSKIVRFLLEDSPQMINMSDGMGRTPLHYAYLFLDQDDTVDYLLKKGASNISKDVNGRTPSDYSRKNCGAHEFALRQKQVREYDLELFLGLTKCFNTFPNAIKAGDLATVKNLTVGLKEHNGIDKFNNALFDCIDHGHFNIAEFLILSGFSTDVWKAYEKCNPDHPMCAMMECGHSVTSFRQRATQLKATSILKLMDDIDKGKVKVELANKSNTDRLMNSDNASVEFCKMGLA
ncbi:uncharacterized protein LOC121383575 [Gigantopelta aegis]|uniref:uncharacterized protein LOC121383575 n=1 Tax=Gigantopelta aegis TaxID=1735272 RepID=UPI001B88C901|nr:uncharacterized protein LOC121383575 [Gigantopelta aegis]XP_041369607.1 uncharacterized protein LOC121383575 [Gigantopelta aegis]XP_041369614.1 uncharacterized protein LOC121383575 [Gigantopelta aegis]